MQVLRHFVLALQKLLLTAHKCLYLGFLSSQIMKYFLYGALTQLKEMLWLGLAGCAAGIFFLHKRHIFAK